MAQSDLPDEAALLKKGLQLGLGIRLSLPPRIDPATVSTKAKIPFKALCIREVLLYRVSELGNAGLECYQQKQLVAAGILSRSLMESVAVLYWMNEKIKTSVENGSTGDIDDFFKKVLIGSRNGSSPLDAYNVLKAIDIVTKDIPHYRNLYEELSEIAHPNYSGALGAYAKRNQETVCYELDTARLPWPMILGPLVTSLELFVHFYDGMILYLKQFAQLCEKELERTVREDGN